MNRLFNDSKQGVFVKVLANPQLLQREVVGSSVFSQFVKTNTITQIDTRTLLIPAVTGVSGDQMHQLDINRQVINIFEDINSDFVGPIAEELSLENLIEELSICFCGQTQVENILNRIYRVVSKSRKLPIHGDLQKQNIFVDKDSNITLIDFEHFCFGPQEFELANSLFHCDDNCLDVFSIIPALVEKKVVNINTLSLMLYLYALKEIAQGTLISVANTNYKRGIEILKRISNMSRFPAPLHISVNKLRVSTRRFCFPE